MTVSNSGASFSLLALLFFAPFAHALEEDRYPIDEKGDQALVILLSTDYHRVQSWHFNPENIPDIVFNSIGFPQRKSKNSRGWIAISPEEKTSCLKHFLEIADRVPSRYFLTNKGFKLGMPPQKVTDYYGNPTRVETTSEGRLLSWDFAGDPSIPGLKANDGQAYFENTYGYHLKILFSNEKATAIIMRSDIP
jgi:hypothetical protein